MNPPGLVYGDLTALQGLYNFTVTVTDGASTAVNKGMTFIVKEIPIIVKDPLPIVESNFPYAFDFQLENELSNVQWEIIDGQLPNGLTLDPDTGIVSGTPTEIGNFNFTITAKN